MSLAEPPVDARTPLTPPAHVTPGVARERLGLEGLDYPIAPEANQFAYMLGGLTFSGILLLIGTGILLDQYYNPSPLAAHDSVVYIMTKVPLGTWLRGLHYWGATIVLVTVFFHTCWVFWRRSYVKPREVTWWAGLALVIVLFALAFTGTVIRGDEEGAEALAHAVAGGKLVGPLGAPVSPDFAQSTNIISRLHSAHVSLLPILLLGLVGLHFWLIRIIGINSRQPKTSRFSEHLPKLLGYAFLLVGLAGLLAAVFPPHIGLSIGPGARGHQAVLAVPLDLCGREFDGDHGHGGRADRDLWIPLPRAADRSTAGGPPATPARHWARFAHHGVLCRWHHLRILRPANVPSRDEDVMGTL